MATILRWVVGLAALSATPLVHAECAFPKPPQEIPDGKTASETDMVAAMNAFKQYNGDVTAYTTCIEKETAEKVREAPGTNIMLIKSLQEKKHNLAVSELKEKANAFNEQVRLYKARK